MNNLVVSSGLHPAGRGTAGMPQRLSERGNMAGKQRQAWAGGLFSGCGHATSRQIRAGSTPHAVAHGVLRMMPDGYLTV